jgi:hypothetical protein
MPTVLDFWCRLFGYDGCKDASTFEAIILVLITLGAASLASAIVIGIIAAGMNRRGVPLRGSGENQKQDLTTGDDSDRCGIRL